tara:strand:+ start:159 stop:806 length:648 start_codon:yes stop_codon:yes gene_type:complete
MESNKYLDDITEIKNMMSRSSRFISLSGLSGILAGVYALIGAYLANLQLGQQLGSASNYGLNSRTEYTQIASNTDLIYSLVLIAVGVILMAAITGILLTIKKSKKSGEKIWDVSSKRLLVNFLIPLLVGGIFCLVLLQYNASGLIAPTTLLFYGLACVNASKYTLGDIRYLGIANIIIGLLSTQFIGYGLYFWALGFGVFHIIYGALMYYKYDRQ